MPQDERVSARAQEFAAEFRTLNDAVIEAIAGYSAAQWQAHTSDEGWTVAATAHHIAVGHAEIAKLIEAIAHDLPLPRVVTLTRDQGNQANLEHAATFADASRDEVLALLRENGAHVSAVVEAFTDADLAKVQPGFPLSTERVIARVLIQHVRAHFASVQTAVAQQPV